jgi:hypothetical protein
MNRYNDGLQAERPWFDSLKGQDTRTSLLNSDHTDYEAQPVSCTRFTRGPFLGGNATGARSWPSSSM